jgi:hypothetical protein
MEFKFDDYVFVDAPNLSFSEKHGYLGTFIRTDNSINDLRMCKTGDRVTVEFDFTFPLRKASEFAVLRGEKVIIHSTVMDETKGTVHYNVVYPDALRGSEMVAPHQLSDWVEPEPPTADDIIADLTEQLYEACLQADQQSKRSEDMEQRLRTQQGYYRSDMLHWESVMRAQKDEQGWCDEGSNRVIAILNDGFIGGWEVELYTEEFEVEVEISSHVSTTYTVTVSATSQDEANSMVIDDPDCFFNTQEALADALNNSYGLDIDVELV